MSFVYRFKAALALLLLGALAFVWFWPRQRPPNIVLIVVDTLRADALGAYGSSTATPYIDKLAESSFLFEKAYANSIITPVSHMSIFTGAYPTTHAALKYWLPEERLSSSIQTLPEVLKKNGYYTAWFGGDGVPMLNPSFGFGRGYDEFHPEDLSTRKSSRLIADWLQNNRSKRFFLFLHSWKPHDPYITPERFQYPYSEDYKGKMILHVGKLRQRLSETNLAELNFPSSKTPYFNDRDNYWRDYFELNPEARFYWSLVDLRKSSDLSRLREGYAGAVSFTDKLVGFVLKDLEQQGLMENTLVVLTSDHGEAFMEHGELGHNTHHDENLHIPLIIRLPRQTQAKQVRVSTQVQSVDIFPTILDLLGLKSPDQIIDGKSRISLLNLPKSFWNRSWFAKESASEPELSFAYTRNQREIASIMDEKYKVIFKLRKLSAVYDRQSDPKELNSLPLDEAMRLPKVQHLVNELLRRVAPFPVKM